MDTPVSKFIPEFKDLEVFESGTVDDYKTVKPQREMTIADLLKHTSGLTYGFLDQTPVGGLYRKLGLDPLDTSKEALSDYIKRLATVPLIFSPGTKWNYSVAMEVLGYIVEVVSGKTYDAFLKEEIFDPLGMVDTGFHVPAEKLERFTSNYIHRNALPIFMPHVDVATLPPQDIFLMDDARQSTYAVPPKLLAGGAGLVSTASDYLKFLMMLYNKGRFGKDYLLSPKTIQLMTANHLPGDVDSNSFGSMEVFNLSFQGIGFGFTFAVNLPESISLGAGSEGTYSWGGAAGTRFFIDPKEELIGIFMTQLMPDGVYPHDRQFRTAIYQSIIESGVRS